MRALSVAGLVAPPECLRCQRPVVAGRPLCGACQEELFAEYYCCRRCAMPLNPALPNQRCVRCRDAKWAMQRVIALGPYAGALRTWVIDLKKPGGELQRRVTADVLAQRLMDEGLVDAERSTLVPVPNHWTHGLGGAADCAGELARELARRLGVSLARRAIVRTRSTAKQGMLTWAERRKNMRGAFRLRDAKMLTARHVILVDDVMTSGATLHELAKVARAGQAATIDAAVVARGTGTRDVPTPYFLKPETRKRSEHGHAGNDA